MAKYQRRWSVYLSRSESSFAVRAEAISDTLLHIAQTPIKTNERETLPNTYSGAYQQASCHVPSIMQIGFTWQQKHEFVKKEIPKLFNKSKSRLLF